MTLAAHLNALEAFGLIRLLQTQPELEYLFRHALVQDAAYESLVKWDRMRLHRAVGEALERLYPAQLASRELAPLLARHFDEAGDEGRALKYLALAGAASAQVYANAEAAAHYARAIDTALSLRADGDLLARLYTRYGRVLELSARDDEALRLYEEMEVVARERRDRDLELTALLARATVYLKPAAVHDPDKGKDLSERALALARELGDRAAEAKSLWNLMQLYRWTGHMPQALAHGEQALALARALDLREQVAYVLHDMAMVYLTTGDFQRARAAGDEAQRLWRELGVLNMLADSLAGAASWHIMSGEYEQALALSQEALRISQSIGNLWNQSYSWYMIDLAYLDRGEMGRAIEVAEECARLAQQAGFVPGLMQSCFDLSFIYGSLGDVRRGREVMERARDVGAGMPLVGPFSELMAARLHVLDGRLAEARQALDTAGRSFEADRYPAFTLWFAGLIEAEWALAVGDYPFVLTRADEGIRLLRQAGIRLFLTDVLHFKGQALRGLGRADEAYATLVEARAEAVAIGSRRSLWPILAALGAIEAQRGKLTEADALRAQAREIVEFIADHTGSPELRASFLNLPDVRDVMRTT